MSEDYANFHPVVETVLADHVLADFPNIIVFTKELLKYMEKQNQSGFYLNSIDQHRDIDRVETTLLTELQKEIGAPIPRQPPRAPSPELPAGRATAAGGSLRPGQRSLSGP